MSEMDVQLSEVFITMSTLYFGHAVRGCPLSVVYGRSGKHRYHRSRPIRSRSA